MATVGPPAKILTHAQRVCRLYKKALKNLYDGHLERHDYRYDAVLMRARFDANKDIKDMRKAAALVAAGEEEVFQKTDYDPFIYRNDEHGITYSRQPHIRDDLLDLWHPWEKANYIDYFEKREAMKDGVAKYWEESLSKKFSGDKMKRPEEWPIISPEVASMK